MKQGEAQGRVVLASVMGQLRGPRAAAISRVSHAEENAHSARERGENGLPTDLKTGGGGGGGQQVHKPQEHESGLLDSRASLKPLSQRPGHKRLGGEGGVDGEDCVLTLVVV